MNASMKPAVAMAVLFALTGCVRAYKPEVYDLPPQRIPAFKVSGAVNYVNAQSPGEVQRSRLNAFTANDYSLLDATAGFNQQLAHEIAKRGRVQGGTTGKLIKSRVTSLACRQPASARLFPTFMLSCDIAVVIETGDGKSLAISASQHAPLFARAGRNGLDRSLDGTLATAAAKALQDRRLLDYLAR